LSCESGLRAGRGRRRAVRLWLGRVAPRCLALIVGPVPSPTGLSQTICRCPKHGPAPLTHAIVASPCSAHTPRISKKANCSICSSLHRGQEKSHCAQIIGQGASLNVICATPVPLQPNGSDPCYPYVALQLNALILRGTSRQKTRFLAI
jgi:hypothetical protein